MARKKRKKSKKGNWKFNLKDERFPKIAGIGLLFFSLCLLVALCSYLFTWQTDQDKILKFSWNIFFQSDLGMANWLGRFGAILSNAFFFWGFGIASFAFVILFTRTGLFLLQRKSISMLFPFYRNSILIMAIVSILSAFIFRKSSFPWGGAFGEGIYFWMSNFLGNIGVVILMVSLVAGFLMWLFNPKFEDLSLNNPLPKIKIPKFDFKTFISGPKKSETESEWKEQADYKPLKPEFFKEHDKKIEEAGGIVDKKGQIEMPLEPTAKPEVFDLNGQESEMEDVVLPNPKDFQKTLDENSGDLEINTAEGKERNALSIEEEDTKHTNNYDPTLDLSNFEHPPLEILNAYENKNVEIDRGELEANKDQIITTLLNYKIEITKIRATIGPTVTLYEIIPAPGVKISKIKNLEDDIALSLAALGIRIIAPIPGKGTIGIEVPNKKPQTVSLKEVLKSDKYQNAKMDLPIALGKTISNDVLVADLAKMPHLLIAGATGQGKSVGINTILMSLLYKKHPSQLKLVLIDPKKVELNIYNDIANHYLAALPEADEPIITETSKVIYTLNSLCIEMDNRYDMLKKARARNIKEYNAKFLERKLNPNNGHSFLPFIVLVIDEFADLIMTAGKEVELPIARLAQLARAVGIHLIIATQRPSVKIITGMIKANFPARLAFKVTSLVDSRTILDSKGAEQLIGRGDMLLNIGSDVVRLQCAFVDTPEVEEVIQHIAKQQGYASPHILPEYVSDEEKSKDGTLKFSDLDSMFEDAARLVVSNQQGSTSMLQRKMKLGYNRAGRIMDQLEALGIVGESRGSKAREVMVFSEMELETILESIKANV